MAKESPPPIRRPRYSEEKKWKCPLCPQSYYDSRTLRRHIVGKHPEGKDLPEVSTATKSKEDLRDYCPHCKKPFVELRKHIKICLEDPKRIVTYVNCSGWLLLSTSSILSPLCLDSNLY